MRALLTWFCIAAFALKAHPQVLRLDGSSISPAELSQRIQTLTAAAGVTGFTTTIFNSDTVAYQEAFGWAQKETQAKLSVHHVFYGASLSKAVFGYLVAQLAQEGVIDLDKPLQDYIPVPIPQIKRNRDWREFRELAGDERYKKITARMCLSHTTGLPNWRWISRTGEFQPEGKLHFYFDPGSDYSYSGEGMQLLQYAIEQITGKGLDQLARERVFNPLGMEMTSYLWQPQFAGKTCNGHTKEEKGIKIDTADETAAAGSMSTTVADYSRFLQHALQLARAGSRTTDLLFTPNIPIRSQKQFGPGALQTTGDNEKVGLNYGLGWGLLTSTPHGKAVFKEGHSDGFQHYSILFPEKGIGILFMSNSDNAESIFREVLEIGIGDVYTPWFWEDYLPYNRKPK